MMCDRHLSLPDPHDQQAKSASRAGCHSSFRSMTIKQEHAASDWNQLALYRSNIGDTQMCDVSRAAQGSLGVQGERLSSLPSTVTAPPPMHAFDVLVLHGCWREHNPVCECHTRPASSFRRGPAPEWGGGREKEPDGMRDSWLLACTSAPFYFTGCQIYLETSNFMFCLGTGWRGQGDSAWDQIKTRRFQCCTLQN